MWLSLKREWSLLKRDLADREQCVDDEGLRVDIEIFDG